MLYLITYGSAHWCGGTSHCVVEASDEHEAESLAYNHMEEEMAELFADEQADSDIEDEPLSTIDEIQEFGAGHECWQYYCDPAQSQFFPKVN